MLETVLNLLLLLIFFDKTFSICEITVVTKCESVSDVLRFGEANWDNLLIESSGNSREEILTPDVFAKIPNVQNVYIVEKLSEIRAGSFNNLNNLLYVKLSRNDIKVLPSGSFRNLKNIQKIDLTNNSIEVLEKNFLENSPVQWLDLSYNRLTSLGVEAVALPSLNNLSLCHNQLTLLKPGCFHANIKYLNLDYNNLQYISVEVIHPLQNLEELILSHNNLDYIVSSGTIRSLQKLDLSFNQIGGIENNAFIGFPALKELYLDHNNLTYLSSKLFGEDNSIEVLHLHWNFLVTLGGEVGAILPHLREITISGNPWACACLDEILYYVGVKKIKSECDRMFFATGKGASCWVSEEKCTGGETVEPEVLAEFRATLKDPDCSKLS